MTTALSLHSTLDLVIINSILLLNFLPCNLTVNRWISNTYNLGKNRTYSNLDSRNENYIEFKVSYAVFDRATKTKSRSNERLFLNKENVKFIKTNYNFNQVPNSFHLPNQLARTTANDGVLVLGFRIKINELELENEKQRTKIR